MREKIKLESSAGTGHFYTTSKNKKTTPDSTQKNNYSAKDNLNPHTGQTGTKTPAK